MYYISLLCIFSIILIITKLATWCRYYYSNIIYIVKQVLNIWFLFIIIFLILQELIFLLCYNTVIGYLYILYRCIIAKQTLSLLYKLNIYTKLNC